MKFGDDTCLFFVLSVLEIIESCAYHVPERLVIGDFYLQVFKVPFKLLWSCKKERHQSSCILVLDED